MPHIKIAAPHSLGREEALRRVKEKAGQLRTAYQTDVPDAEETWEDNQGKFRFTLFGLQIGGTVTVDDQQVVVDTEVPMMAMMFKGQVEGRVREELSQLLA